MYVSDHALLIQQEKKETIDQSGSVITGEFSHLSLAILFTVTFICSEEGTPWKVFCYPELPEVCRLLPIQYNSGNHVIAKHQIVCNLIMSTVYALI